MRFKYSLLLVGLGLIVGTAAGFRQLHGRSEGTGGNDAPEPGPTKVNQPGSLQQDWNQLAGDAPVWRRADITDPHQLFIFDLAADRLRCTNGEITREQFLGMTRPTAAARPEGAAPANQAVVAKQKVDGPRAPTPDTPAAASHDVAPADPAAAAEFRKLDVNRDGLLSYDEMDDVLRSERSRWDTNKDGFIDLEEYREYFKARTQPSRLEERKAEAKAKAEKTPEAPSAPAAALSATSAALGAVNQSMELPEEFRKLDTDHDGQIGLYEWKAAGLPVAQFLEKDLNGDGFLTPDELLPRVEVANNNPPGAQPAPAPAPVAAVQNEINWERAVNRRAARLQLERALSGGGGQIQIKIGR
jgi:Ca2+-binding EF-hand superfamily protein